MPLPTSLDSPIVAPGSGRLEIDMVSGQSAVTAVAASSPLKILVPRPRGTSVWAYLSSFGGGLVAGDETSLNLRLAPHTRCFVSSQASTKVYRNPRNRPCGHRLQARVESGGLLVLAPDPVQAFAGSQYRQRQEFHLAGDAGLVLVDWFNSGRAARGERWAFTRFQSRNDVFVDGRRRWMDSVLLETADTTPQLGRFNCVALVVVIGQIFQANYSALLTAIADEPVARRAALSISASPITDGVLLRLAGESSEQVGREIRRRLDFVSAWLGDDPWIRKW